MRTGRADRDMNERCHEKDGGDHGHPRDLGMVHGPQSEGNAGGRQCARACHHRPREHAVGNVHRESRFRFFALLLPAHTAGEHGVEAKASENDADAYDRATQTV